MLVLNKYKQLISYLIFGVLTTLVNIIVYYLFSSILNINYLISNGIAWIISVTFAYITNKLYVFESDNENVILELIKFYISRLTTGVIDIVLMWLFVVIFIVNDMYAKIIVNIIVIILNYIFSKFFIFKEE